MKLALSPESSEGCGGGLQAMASTASKDANNHHLVATLTSDSQVIQLRDGISLKVLQHVRLLDIHMGLEETPRPQAALTFTQFQDKLYLVTLSQSGNNLTTFRVSQDGSNKVINCKYFKISN